MLLVLCATGSAAGEDIVITVELFCTEKSHLQHEALSFPAYPSNILSIKKRVQEEFSIPVDVQNLTYKDHCYPDSTTVEQAGIRSGDTLVVRYSSEGDCQQIDETVEWLGTLEKWNSLK